MALNKENNFLQSDIWRKFQEAVGHKTFAIEEEGFSASIIEHKLPIVGKYFYVPRGPIMEHGAWNMEQKNGFDKLFNLAKENNAGWIRIEPGNEEMLEIIKKDVDYKINQAPHDMQPREILVIDVSKSEKELLTDMKSKARYNIKLAEKKGVKIGSSWNMEHVTCNKKYINEFVRLIKLTEKRKSIKFHSANYYQKMLEVIPSNILKLYVADYNGKIIAANLMIFFGDTATYLHGATDDEYRNVMAPYLLQWQAIKDAKKVGYKFYDFGGIKTVERSDLAPTLSLLRRGRKGEVNPWSGITKFKLGFAPETGPTRFLGSFDLVVNAPKYFIYRLLSQLKSIF